MKKFNLTSQILLALILGIITGLILYPFKNNIFVHKYILNFLFKFLGNGFLRAIKMIVVPLVFCSLTVGAAGVEDIKKLGRIGIRTLIFYLSTTAMAVILALFIGNILNPGKGILLKNIVSSNEITLGKSQSIIDILLNIIPSNPIRALSQGNMLQIIVFAILLGVTISILGEKARTVKKIFEEFNEITLKIVGIIMKFAPYGVYGLIATAFTTLGYTAMLPLIKYFLAVVLALLLHYLITYQSLLIILGKYNPLLFLKKFSSTMMVAFSTSSSNACIPSSLKTMQEEFGVSKSISSFTIPLGSTINMDGTAIMQGIATIFIAQIYGVHLSMNDYIIVILTATLASIGTAGVPGVGVIMLSMVLTEVGLPLEGIALIMGIDRFVDMFRTTVNITGDAICTLIIAKSENENIK